jgi:hypothetical protein
MCVCARMYARMCVVCGYVYAYGYVGMWMCGYVRVCMCVCVWCACGPSPSHMSLRVATKARALLEPKLDKQFLTHASWLCQNTGGPHTRKLFDAFTVSGHRSQDPLSCGRVRLSVACARVITLCTLSTMFPLLSGRCLTELVALSSHLSVVFPLALSSRTSTPTPDMPSHVWTNFSSNHTWCAGCWVRSIAPSCSRFTNPTSIVSVTT